MTVTLWLIHRLLSYKHRPLWPQQIFYLYLKVFVLVWNAHSLNTIKTISIFPIFLNGNRSFMPLPLPILRSRKEESLVQSVGIFHMNLTLLINRLPCSSFKTTWTIWIQREVSNGQPSGTWLVKSTTVDVLRMTTINDFWTLTLKSGSVQIHSVINSTSIKVIEI